MFGKSNSNVLAGTINKGLSISHENTSNSNPVINNNININHNDSTIEVQNNSSNDNEPSKELTLNIDIKALQKENEFLKAILNIYINQKLYFNGKYIVCTSDELIELIKLLTEAESVDIEFEPIEISCLGNPKVPYAKILNIWINKGGERVIFKYNYSNLLSLFEECKISLKSLRI